MKKRTILIIDDEEANQEMLSCLLEREFETLGALSGEEGLRIARAQQPDLIILDLLMPRQDGIVTCELLRSSEATRHIPIVMLTGSQQADPRIQAFACGADDFIHKPFDNKELIARLHSKLRRVREREGTGEVLDCGNLSLDLTKVEVRVETAVVQLSVLEFNLLKYLVQNKNRVISRQQILDAVWRDSVVSDRTVDTHMASIRKKLAPTPFDHEVATIYAAGYILRERPRRDESRPPA